MDYNLIILIPCTGSYIENVGVAWGWDGIGAGTTLGNRTSRHVPVDDLYPHLLEMRVAKRTLALLSESKHRQLFVGSEHRSRDLMVTSNSFARPLIGGIRSL